MNANTEVLAERPVDAGKARVVDTMEYSGRVRYLMVNKTVQSAIYLGEDRRYDLLFPYLDRITWTMNNDPCLCSIFLIGGGAFAFPRTVIHKYPACRITAAENDPAILKLAEDFFDLRLTQKEAGDRLKIVCGDGLKALEESNEKYDLIINDAFFGGRSVARNAKDTAMIKEHLSERGIYVTNVTGAQAGIHAYTVRRYRNMLRKLFTNVRMIVAEEDRDPREKQNILAYASERDLDSIL